MSLLQRTRKSWGPMTSSVCFRCLCRDQFGFQQHRSTTLTLIDIVEDIQGAAKNIPPLKILFLSNQSRLLRQILRTGLAPLSPRFCRFLLISLHILRMRKSYWRTM